MCCRESCRRKRQRSVSSSDNRGWGIAAGRHRWTSFGPWCPANWPPRTRRFAPPLARSRCAHRARELSGCPCGLRVGSVTGAVCRAHARVHACPIRLEKLHGRGGDVCASCGKNSRWSTVLRVSLRQANVGSRVPSDFSKVICDRGTPGSQWDES